MSKLIVPSVASLLALAFTGCEVWGTYDYMMDKFTGHWNYQVVGSLAITAVGPFLPLFAEYCRRIGYRVLGWALYAAVPFALAFVFQAAVTRTGGVVDGDEAMRAQISERIKIAKAEEAEAAAQLPIDQQMVKSNCEIIGSKCTKAMDAKAATEGKLARARAKLEKQTAAVDDPVVTRLRAWFPSLTKQEIQLAQPLLVPMGLALFSFLLFSVAARGFGQLLATPVPAPVDPEPAKPKEIEEPVLEAPKVQQKPKLVVVKKELPVSFTKALTELLEPADKGRTDIADLFRAYATRVDAQMTPEEFIELARLFCSKTRIKTAGKFLLGVKIVANMSQMGAI